jgi:hypothetical protein
LTVSIQIIVIGIVSVATARFPPLALTTFGAVALAAAGAFAFAVTVSALGGALDDCAIRVINGIGLGGYVCRCDGLAGDAGRAAPTARAGWRVGRQVAQATVTVVTP